MKIVALILTAWLLSACGAPFEPADLGPSSAVAGSPGLGAAGAPDASAGAPSEAGSGGRGGAQAAGGAPAGGSAAGGAQAGLPCSGAALVTGGYASLGTAATCLRTKEALNTLGCSNADGRSLSVNGMPVTCGDPFTPPPRIDGYNYIAVGAGPSSVMTLRWFLTAPSSEACAARYWALGEQFAAGQLALEICNAPGKNSACALGQEAAFSCVGTRCSNVAPGGNNWQDEWVLVTVCGS